MRRAAGILMIIFGGILTGILVYDGIQVHYRLDSNLLMSSLYVFVIIGGVFCLRRKYWKVCFISSLILSCPVYLPWVWVVGPLIFYIIFGGIISLVFVCLRKREWQEISA